MLFANKSASPLKRALHNPWCHFISDLWRVSLAEYIRVLRVYPTILQVKFSACLKWWLTAGGLGDYIYFSSVCFYQRMSLMLAMYLELILLSLIGFETQTCIIISELIVNIISAANSVYVMYICLIVRSWLWCWFTKVLRDTRWTTGFI